MSKQTLSFIVIRHSTKEEVDKETIYSVALKTKKGATTEASMEIKSTSSNLFSEYPLDAAVEVITKQSQTTLTEIPSLEES